MTKVLATIFLLHCVHLCIAQQSYSFVEVERYLKDRNYTLGYPSRLEQLMPRVELQLSDDMPVEEVFKQWLAGTRISYLVDEDKRHITLIFRDTSTNGSLYRDLEGTVLTTSNEPLIGATVTVAGTTTSISTGRGGHFRLGMNGFTTKVIISHIGCATQTLTLSNKTPNEIFLPSAPEGLDKVIVQAYGRTSRRTNTGDIHVVGGVDSMADPSGSLQDAIEARVPGLFISEANGTAGSAKMVSLGGMHSIQGNNLPLYVVDGVPLAADGFLSPIGSGSAQGPGGANSLNFITPENIASIEVLQDAAATSIYGSRASNGVILVTLKTGKAGPLRLSFDVNGGVSGVVHTSPLLSTPQFLQLRKEAVLNDGLAVGPPTVPENYSPWDSTRQTNFQRLTTGGTASIWNAGLQASGGSTHSYYLLSGQVHQETTVFPGETSDDRRSLYSYLHTQTDNGKLQFNFSGMYSSESNHLPVADFSQYALLAPDAPAFTNAAGQPQWGLPPLSFVNIPALTNNDYLGNVYSVFGHLQVVYRPDDHFSFEESLGYNGVLTTEQASRRLAGQDPNSFPIGVVNLAHNQYTQSITETIGRWTDVVGPGRLEGLLGVDWQQRNTAYNSLQSIGFPNDMSLNAGIGATSFVPMSNKLSYRYAAAFGRANYNVANKYLLTASWRRDGSSRLGDQAPYGNFWAVGGAWVFTEEPWMSKDTSILNFGKIRASYGTTGNEPDLDDQYEEVYTQSPSSRGYQGQQGLQPLTLANPQLHWELNYREELALDLELLHHRLWLSAAAYRSWTANQVINTTVGPVAGLPRVLMNVPGIDVENRALEFEIQVNQLRIGPLHWTSSLVLTLPRNRLAAWPGLDATIYATTYTIGHSLSSSKSFHWTGVDPKTGYYTFQTNNPSGQPGVSDEVPNAGLDPLYYAGWSHTLRMGSWQLDILLDYRRQRGYSPLVVLDQQLSQLRPMGPGSQGLLQLSNGPVEWLDHWRKTGDRSRQQRVSSGEDTVAADRLYDYMSSDAWSIDASYLRLRSATLSWHLPAGVIKRWKIQDGSVYLRGQNLLTLTRFPVSDPETQDPRVLPPMRTVVAGMRISF